MKDDLKQCPETGLFLPADCIKPEKPKPNWPPQIDIPENVRGRISNPSSHGSETHQRIPYGHMIRPQS